ncbi:hypothetical protein HHK36_019918 [Tetracentron sinense]|uniref:PGG domain-containing protein n=1 Tax=Tetracentron sinense TaxID=13715 RepID=A0A834YUK4_TETSI|nr:hypothetical protein HHK36_019918 [Tetracentron sinense]
MAMEKQKSFRVAMEKQKSFRVAIEKQKSFRGAVMEKQKSFHGAMMEKQKSFRIAMEKQQSFREKKKSIESPRKRGDSPLHLAVRAGDLMRVKQIIEECESSSSSDLKDLLSKQNQDRETPLYAAAENGHLPVVSELLKHLDLQTASLPTKNGYDPFHIAAKHGHLEVLKELLHSFPNLAMTTDSSNHTPLHTAAIQGHIDVVNLLLETDSNLAKIARSNGKTVLHSAARMGHLEVVKSLLSKDSSIGFRVDKKGQTALHMAVKGQNVDIVQELLKPDPKVMIVEDNKGNTALHIATKKGRTQTSVVIFMADLEIHMDSTNRSPPGWLDYISILKILLFYNLNGYRTRLIVGKKISALYVKIVRCLLSFEGININAINNAGESPLDIAEKSESPEITSILREAGATTAKEQGKPPNAAKQLKQTVSDIKHDVHSQLQQTRQTGVRVQKIAKRLKKLHISGLNNAINSATVVAVLIATVAFAAIFTVPGQFVENKVDGYSVGQAYIAKNAAFIIFFVFDSLALFISLAVVVVQTSVVVIEQKAKKQLMFVINKLMWLACLFISVAFISLTYIVVGQHARWLAVYATVLGGSIMLTTLGSMCYCVILHRIEESNMRNIRRASMSRSFSMSMVSDPEMLNSEYKRMILSIGSYVSSKQLYWIGSIMQDSDLISAQRKRLAMKGGWEECWEQELTPWDLGQPTPMILHLHQTGVLPKGRALVPGCGSGHDVVAIACPERYVVGLDISDNAIKKARELSSSLPNANYLTFIKADFFTLHPAELFDLIFDYTFFCAIVPHMRSAWASQVRDILKPDGELITLMFPISDHDGGPPYKVSVADYEEVLHPMGFKAISIVDNDLAIGPRKCKEFWQDSSSLIGVQMTCLELIQGAKTSSSGEYSGDRRDRFLRGFTYNIGRTSKHCGTTFWEKIGTANLVLEWPSEDLTEYDPAPAL